jgi:hypothetical protein
VVSVVIRKIVITRKYDWFVKTFEKIQHIYSEHGALEEVLNFEIH